VVRRLAVRQLRCGCDGMVGGMEKNLGGARKRVRRSLKIEYDRGEAVSPIS